MSSSRYRRAIYTIPIALRNRCEQEPVPRPTRYLALTAAATVHVVSREKGEIKGWDKKDWGRPVKVDKAIDEVKAADYDAIVLPGGQINPGLLRVNDKTLKLRSVTRPGC
jgi:protease I